MINNYNDVSNSFNSFIKAYSSKINLMIEINKRLYDNNEIK